MRSKLTWLLAGCSMVAFESVMAHGNHITSIDHSSSILHLLIEHPLVWTGLLFVSLIAVFISFGHHKK